MKRTIVSVALLAAAHLICASPLLANLMSVTSILRVTQATGSGPTAAGPFDDHQNTDLSPTYWNDQINNVLSGTDNENISWGYIANPVQESDFSETFGLFGANLFTTAITYYDGVDGYAQAGAFTAFGPNFTITQPLYYSFTATGTGHGPTDFYLYYADGGVAIFDGFAESGSGILQPGSYYLYMSLLDQSYSKLREKTGDQSSGVLFRMTLSPVPEPSALFLAGPGLAGLLLAVRRRAR